MKKKITALMRDGSLAGNAEYEPLHKSYLLAVSALDRAKKAKTVAKKAYREAFDQGEKDQDRMFELLTALRQAKCMQRFHSAGLKLKKHLLHRWLENRLKNTEVPHEPKKSDGAKVKAKNPKPKKAPAGPAKTPKAPKAPAKAAKKAG